MKFLRLMICLMVAVSMLAAPNAFAAKREKFGVDQRH